jgi:hypothetical protein
LRPDDDAAGQGAPVRNRRYTLITIAEDVAVFQDDVANVDAGTVPDTSHLRLGRLAPCDAGLDLDRALEGFHRACELDQRAVAGELDHATAVLGNQGFGEFDPMSLDPGERTGLVGADQPAVAHHVHGHDGREPAIHARSGPWQPPQVSLQNNSATGIFNPDAC